MRLKRSLLYNCGQLELRSMKSKVKLKGQVTSQQDTLLQEKQNTIDKGLSEIHLLRHEVDHLKTDNEGLKKKVSFFLLLLRPSLPDFLVLPLAFLI